MNSAVRKELTPQQCLNRLLEALASERFLKNQGGIDMAVPLYIYSYPTEKTGEINQIREKLVRELFTRALDVLDLDLYDLALHILKERRLLDPILEEEKDFSKEELFETLQNVLDAAEYLIPEILHRRDEVRKSRDVKILFLSGVAEVYPYIRAHSVLSSLQKHSDLMPVVMFFPGQYVTGLEGDYLSLFGRLQNDRYYRAYDLDRF